MAFVWPYVHKTVLCPVPNIYNIHQATVERQTWMDGRIDDAWHVRCAVHSTLHNDSKRFAQQMSRDCVHHIFLPALKRALNKWLRQSMMRVSGVWTEQYCSQFSVVCMLTRFNHLYYIGFLLLFGLPLWGENVVELFRVVTVHRMEEWALYVLHVSAARAVICIWHCFSRPNNITLYALSIDGRRKYWWINDGIQVKFGHDQMTFAILISFSCHGMCVSVSEENDNCHWHCLRWSHIAHHIHCTLHTTQASIYISSYSLSIASHERLHL